MEASLYSLLRFVSAINKNYTVCCNTLSRDGQVFCQGVVDILLCDEEISKKKTYSTIVSCKSQRLKGITIT
jgi:hypothetical protein